MRFKNFLKILHNERGEEADKIYIAGFCEKKTKNKKNMLRVISDTLHNPLVPDVHIKLGLIRTCV